MACFVSRNESSDRLLASTDIKFGPAPMASNLRTAEALKMDCSAAREELGYAPEYYIGAGPLGVCGERYGPVGFSVALGLRPLTLRSESCLRVVRRVSWIG